jgi:hypothetical protein
MRQYERAQEAARKKANYLEFVQKPIDVHPDYVIRVGAIIQRDPIILPPLDDIEREYWQWKFERDNQQSLGFMDFTPEAERTLYKYNAQGRRLVDIVPEEAVESVEYMDDNSNLRNIARLLDQKLYFAIKTKADPQHWTLPSFTFTSQKQPLHIFLRRHLKDIFTQCQLYHVARVPVAHYLANRKAPMEATFYFRSHLVQGDLGVLHFPDAIDYSWLSSDEMAQASEPEWYSSLRPILSY